jgi:hypothetical protein
MSLRAPPLRVALTLTELPNDLVFVSPDTAIEDGYKDDKTD